jgi:hypothetical protein
MAPLGKLPTELIECETLNARHSGEFIKKYGADETYVEEPPLMRYKRRRHGPRANDTTKGKPAGHHATGCRRYSGYSRACRFEGPIGE